MRPPLLRFAIVLSACLAWTACSDDSDGDSAGDASGDTTQDIAGDSGTDSATQDVVEETTDDSSVDSTPDAVESGTIAIEGVLSLSDSPIDSPVASEGAGGFMFALLPGGYEMDGNPSEDIIAAALLPAPADYAGAALETGDSPILFKEWDSSEEDDDNPLSEDDFLAEAGTYSVLVIFMSNFQGDGPDNIAGPTDYDVTSFPAVLDLGDLSLTPAR